MDKGNDRFEGELEVTSMLAKIRLSNDIFKALLRTEHHDLMKYQKSCVIDPYLSDDWSS